MLLNFYINFFAYLFIPTMSAVMPFYSYENHIPVLSMYMHFTYNDLLYIAQNYVGVFNKSIF